MESLKTTTTGGLSSPHFKEIPDEWRSNPQLFDLAIQHQAWLANITTERLHYILRSKLDSIVNEISALAVNRSSTDAEVRIVAIRLNELRQLEKTIYDTKQFVQSATRPKQ